MVVKGDNQIDKQERDLTPKGPLEALCPEREGAGDNTNLAYLIYHPVIHLKENLEFYRKSCHSQPLFQDVTGSLEF